ncbi:hypothetical protein KPL39_18440 [Clostridium gasigenes]|uniref:hypothetical protein n=1 Tax=Clostridium gasigenes TaxID=94869 RepID=UPI001C0D02E0|nr:hypothetical protein [Clostridium gasigenes]MBU3138209.1 hypothetical protein [Clostridium gasigenes]
MKKIIGIIIALMIMLTGCSNPKKGVDNTNTQSVDNTTYSNDSSNDSSNESSNDSSDDSSNDKQTQPQSGNKSKNIKDDNSNIDSSLIDNIDTTKSPFEKGYYDYQGTISNNMAIQMSIYPLEKDIVGSYFYDSKRIEIKLKGKAGAKDIVLYEYNEAGENTGTFKGTMNTIDKIEGTWLSADGKQSYPFTLSLKSNIPGSEYGRRYALAISTKSDQDVENFVSEIQSYIINDNKEQLAERVKYPINVKIDGKVTEIQNKDGFIKNYNQIFHSSYKEAIGNAYTKYLFVNWQGIMFGEGAYNIWINEINSELMITAINN